MLKPNAKENYFIYEERLPPPSALALYAKVLLEFTENIYG